MDVTYFERFAQLSGCRSVEAANLIKFHAIKKRSDEDSNPARQDSATLERSTSRPSIIAVREFIPTPDKLRAALTDQVILDLLGCRCQHLCGPQWQDLSAADDVDLARNIYAQFARNEWKMEIVAILILSGALFALRRFHDSDYNSLEMFLNNLEQENLTSTDDDYGDRHALFGNFQEPGDRWDNDILCAVTNWFLESVRSKLWLTRIHHFKITDELKKFDDERRRYNFPFVDEHNILPASDNRQYIRFRIADNCASKELEVWSIVLTSVVSL